MASVTFPIGLGGDGSTVTDDRDPVTGLRGGGYRTRFVPALQQTVAVLNGGIAQVAAEGAEQIALVAAEGAEQIALATAQAVRAETAAEIAVGAANYRGDYSAIVTYTLGQSVTYLGQRFIAKKTNLGITPVDGADWFLLEIREVPDGIYLRDFTTQTAGNFVVPDGVFTIRAYTGGKGGDGAPNVGNSAAGGGGGGFAFGDIATTPGETLVFSTTGGVAKLSRGAVDLLVGNPGANAAGNTGGAGGGASLDASVTNGGAFTGAAGGGAAGGFAGGGSSGSPLGNGFVGGATAGGQAANRAGGGGIVSAGQTATGGVIVGGGGNGLPRVIPYLDSLLLSRLGTGEMSSTFGAGGAGNVTGGSLAGGGGSATSRACGGGGGNNQPGGPATLWIFY